MAQRSGPSSLLHQVDDGAHMHWSQGYNPLGSAFASTLVAALPIIVLLGCIASGRIKAHIAALAGLATALLIAGAVLRMPASTARAACVTGAAYGLLPIGWIVLNILFLYQLTKEQGAFDQMQSSIATVSSDRRVQLVLIAFALGSFFEGTAGFGTPVAITGALLIGLGFAPLEASALSLIANTAPVAFGAMGTPIVALAGVTGIDAAVLSKMIGRQLPIFSLIVPFWLIAAYDGLRGIREVWPTILVAGISFAVPQFLVSNYHGPALVDVVSSICCLVCVTLFARYQNGRKVGSGSPATPATAKPELAPWVPWL